MIPVAVEPSLTSQAHFHGCFGEREPRLWQGGAVSSLPNFWLLQGAVLQKAEIPMVAVSCSSSGETRAAPVT